MVDYITGKGSSDASSGTTSTATSDPNTLVNKSYAQGIDLLGEGEWAEVPVNGLKGIYVDGTPVQSSDGTTNFTGVNFETRVGTVDQARLSVSGSTTQSSHAVGVEMIYNQPALTTVTGSDIDYLKVVVALKGLYHTDTKTGAVRGSSVSYKIEYNSIDNPTWRTIPVTTDIVYTGIAYSETTPVTGYTHYKITSEIYPAEYYIGESINGFIRNAPCRYKVQVSEDLGETWVTWLEDTTSSPININYIYTTTPQKSVLMRVVTTTLESFDTTIGTLVTTEYNSVSDFYAGKSPVNDGIQTITGKCASTYEREHSFRVEGDAPFSVRVTKLTPDSTTEYDQNTMVFQSITTVVEDKFVYPFCVLVGWSVDASQFSTIPTRSYLCKMLKVKIPSNYDPIERTYNGVWDGSFSAPTWTDNPAWCFRDLLTNDRYGLGQRISESAIDDAELYQIAQYCDELVPDGSGGFEPRFTCNLVLQSQEQAYKVIADIASIFKGITYWASGTIMPVQDSPKETSYHFNNTNVESGSFVYQGSSGNSRFNAVYVSWNDPKDMYRQSVEFVADEAAIAKTGFMNSTSITAFGCTSRGQARRAGKWLLYTNTLETEITQFTTSLEGLLPKPGNIIGISDTLRSAERRGGRIVSVDGLNVTLDAEMAFVGGVPYTISVITEDGTIEDRIFFFTGVTNVIGLTTPFSKPLAKDSIFVIADSAIPEKLFRVISVTDKDDFKYEITAVSYNPSKFDHIDRDEPLVEISKGQSGVGVASEFVATEMQYEDGASVKVKVECAWRAPARAVAFDVYITNPDGTVTESLGQKNAGYVIYNASKGVYQVRIVCVDVLKRRGSPYDNTLSVLNAVYSPSAITGAKLTASNGSGILSWDLAKELNVRVGGLIVVKYTPKTSGAAWTDGTIIARVSGASCQCTVPLLVGTYMLKAVNIEDKWSYEAAKVVSSKQGAEDVKDVDYLIEHPLFEGVKQGCSVINSELVFNSGGGSMYGISTMYSVDSMFNLEGNTTTPTYYFHDYKVFDYPCRRRLIGNISAYAYSETDTINSRLTAVNTWSRWNGEVYSSDTIKLWISTSPEPDGEGVEWTEWEEFVLRDYEGKGFKFKLTVDDIDDGYSIRVPELSILFQSLARTVSGDNVLVPVEGKTITYDNGFEESPAITIRINGQLSGEYAIVSDITRLGFHVSVVDSAGTPVERSVDYICKGYGTLV